MLFFLLFCSANTSATQTKQEKDDSEEREKTPQKYVLITFYEIVSNILNQSHFFLESTDPYQAVGCPCFQEEYLDFQPTQQTCYGDKN